MHDEMSGIASDSSFPPAGNWIASGCHALPKTEAHDKQMLKK